MKTSIIGLAALAVLGGCATTGSGRWTGNPESGDFWVGCTAAADMEVERRQAAGLSEEAVNEATLVRIVTSTRRGGYRPDLSVVEMQDQLAQARADIGPANQPAVFEHCRSLVTRP